MFQVACILISKPLAMKRLFVNIIIGTLVLTGCTELEKPALKVHEDETTVENSFLNGDRTLPVMFLTTASGKGITDKEDWEEAAMSVRTAEGIVNVSASDIQVKGRGNASWAFPKKAFDILFDSPEPLLGMPAGERWCMLANWRDITLMRNAVALEIARMTSLDWTPEGRFVDLVIDGRYMGNYYLTQKVDISSEHVNVGENGVLLCFDSYFDKDFRFRSQVKKLPVNVILSSGSTLDGKAFSALKGYISDVENSLYSGKGNWRDYLDEESFCDWLIVHELTENNEPTRPHSVYMHRSSDGKLCAGPAWDFDCRTFRPGVTGLLDGGAVWYDALLSDPGFVKVLKLRWRTLKPSFEEHIPEFIDSTFSLIRSSAELNTQMWPINTVLFSSNGDEQMEYSDAVALLRSAFIERLASLDEAIMSL